MDKNIFTSEFIDLLKDDKFVKLVQKTENPDQLLKDLVGNNKDNTENIKYAFEFIRTTKEDKRSPGIDKSNQVLENIKKGVWKRKLISINNYNFSLFKVASIIIAVLAIGGGIILSQQQIHDPLAKFAQKDFSGDEESLIVLSDGSKNSIKDNDSFIEIDPNSSSIKVKRDNNLVDQLKNEENSNSTVLNQLITPYGQHQTVRLSDGTVVQLNAGSKLTFPSKFSGKTREVYLKGEGFFEVHKNADQPFIVKTDYLDIKVLGTTFNVSVYEDEEIASAVLVEGAVNVSQKNRILNNQEYKLSPGQGCFYKTDKQESEVRAVDTEYYTSWKDGVFKFNKMLLLDVVRRVKKYYNVQIQIEGVMLSEKKITGKLSLTGEINDALQFLSKTVNGRYEKNDDGIYILKTNN